MRIYMTHPDNFEDWRLGYQIMMKYDLYGYIAIFVCITGAIGVYVADILPEFIKSIAY